jgi:hypothetical protein
MKDVSQYPHRRQLARAFGVGIGETGGYPRIGTAWDLVGMTGIDASVLMRKILADQESV